jgi:hypothetical protein
MVIKGGKGNMRKKQKTTIRTIITMHIISGSLAIGSIIWQTYDLKKYIKEKAYR